MLKKSFLSSLYVIPTFVAVLFFATQVWVQEFLITPPQISGFSQQVEYTVSLLTVVFFSILLPNKFEIELGLVNGYGTMKLALTKALPVYVYAVVTAIAFVALYRYMPFDLDGFKTYLPIYVPDDFRIYVFISVFVTVTFFSSVYFFMRVLTRNCFLPVIADLLLVTVFMNITNGIRKGMTDAKMCLVDPFISTYFIGNTIPDRLFTEYKENAILKSAWTFNRLFFFILSLAFFAVTILLLRREKLHGGIGQ